MKKSIILGTGPLGMAVMDELVKTEQIIVMVNRSGQLKETVPENVSVVPCDLTNTEELRKVCATADDIYMCAIPPYHKWVTDLEPMMDSVIVATEGKQLIFGDNLYMYGEKNTVNMKEDTNNEATTKKGITRKKVARKLLDANESKLIKLKIGRASDFYGPRVYTSAFSKGFFDSIIKGKKPVLWEI